MRKQYGEEWVERTKKRLERAILRAIRGYEVESKEASERAFRIVRHAWRLGWVDGFSIFDEEN